MWDWLDDSGKVFIISATPYSRMWQEFIPIFENNIEKGVEWPGYIEDFSIFKHNKRFNEIPDFMHFLAPEILKEKFEQQGFIVERYGFCDRNRWPEDMRLDGRESIGLIATKV